MSEPENTATVHKAYDISKTGNIQALLDQMTDDVTCQLP